MATDFWGGFVLKEGQNLGPIPSLNEHRPGDFGPMGQPVRQVDGRAVYGAQSGDISRREVVARRVINLGQTTIGAGSTTHFASKVLAFPYAIAGVFMNVIPTGAGGVVACRAQIRFSEDPAGDSTAFGTGVDIFGTLGQYDTFPFTDRVSLPGLWIEAVRPPHIIICRLLVDGVALTGFSCSIIIAELAPTFPGAEVCGCGK